MKRRQKATHKKIVSVLLTLILLFSGMVTFSVNAADYDHTINVSAYDQTSPPGLKQALATATADSGKTYLINAVGSFPFLNDTIPVNVTFVIKNGVILTSNAIDVSNKGTIIVENGGKISLDTGSYHNSNKTVIQNGGIFSSVVFINKSGAVVENNGGLEVRSGQSGITGGLHNYAGGIINNSGTLINDNAGSQNNGIINLLPGGSITGHPFLGTGSVSYSPVVSGTNSLSGSQGAVGVQTVTVALSTSHSSEEITLTATIGGKTAVATKTGDGDATFSFAATDLNALAGSSYHIMVSAPSTTNNKAIAATQVGTLTVLATDKEITSFALGGNSCTISGTNISLAVPYGAAVTNMTPVIVHTGASVSPASGIPHNFTSPVTYTVTAADGSTQAYTVTVTVGAQTTYAVTVVGGAGNGNFPQGATVNVTANTPPTGQKFDKWVSSSGVIFANEKMAATSFTMPAKAVSITATYKAIPPTAEKYTITLGASGNGTVSGGGTFDENTTVTVTATPNAGSSFVNWTENGIAVSTDANYNFAVTTDRTLIAVFEKNGTDPDPVDPPVTPPTTYSRSSDSSVGSNKADTSPNLKPAVVGRLFTKAEATKLFGAALAAKPAEQKTLSFRAQNFTKVDKAVLAELGALAQKNGVTLTVHFDSMVGKAVTYRVSVNPATIQTDLDLTAKIVGGKLTLPKFPVPVEIAVRMPAGVTMETLKITENGKNVTTAAKPWLDKVGYLHFTTTGGEIVLGK